LLFVEASRILVPERRFSEFSGEAAAPPPQIPASP